MASIRKRIWKNSTGETSIRWAVDFFDAQGNRQRKQFDNRREADAFRIEIEGQLRSGTYRPDAQRITVQEAAEPFLDYCKGRMKRGERMTRQNYEFYEGHVRNYICPDPAYHASIQRFCKTQFFKHGLAIATLAQLSASMVGNFRDKVREHGCSVSTTRKILGTLRLILDHAISRDLLAVNIARAVKVIGRRDEAAKKIIPPSKDALRRLLAVAKRDFQVQLAFAAMTGVRASELHALRWRHIDFEGGSVSIETRVDRWGEEDTTKTLAGVRTVPIGQSLIAMLQEWRLRTFYSDDNDLVFPARRGRILRHESMIRWNFNPLFAHLAQLYEMNPALHPPAPKRFNWHALRHFAISCWIEAGLSPKTVQTFAGHSSLSVTDRPPPSGPVGMLV